MKRELHRIIFAIMTLVILGSQNLAAKRLVLMEQFTNTGCGPCARFTPSADSLLIVRLGDVVAIKYHGNYPSPKDPFYLAEPDNIDMRTSFYEVTGVPAVFLDGKQISSNVAAISTRIDELMANDQKLNIKVENSVSDGVLNVKVGVRPFNSYDNDNLRLFVAVIEEEIIFDSPVPNGETDFRFVLNKLLPDANGYNLGKLTDTEKEYTFETSYTLANFYNTDQLAIVAFVQDIATREVYETVYAPRQTDKDDAAKVILVQKTPDKICSPHYTAEVLFRNTGNNPITSANICVDINGSVQKTPWTGNLAYLESATVTTPDFTDFTLEEDGSINNVKIYVSDINNSNARSINYNLTFDNAVEAQESVQLTLFTDNKPEESTWELYNSANILVDQGGPYTEKRTFEKKMLNLVDDDCYRLVFYDSGKDGIKGSFGNGYYKLDQVVGGKRKMVVQGDYDGETHQVFFSLKNSSGVTSVEINDEPIYDAGQKSLYVPTAGRVVITDLQGRTVYVNSVEANTTIDLTPLHGVYIVSLMTNPDVHTLKIIIK